MKTLRARRLIVIDSSMGSRRDGYVKCPFLGVVFCQFGLQLSGEVRVLLDGVGLLYQITGEFVASLGIFL